MTEASKPVLPSTSTVERIIRAVETTDIEVVELTWGGIHVRVAQDAERLLPASTGPAEEGDPTTIPITAPLTGVFYGRAAPEQPPFVEVGSFVAAGQVVGLIETMKLFNEIVSEVEGEVAEILVAEGDLVEAEQVLIRLRPNEEGHE